MPNGSSYRPAPHWAELGEGFSDPVEPARFPQHRLLRRLVELDVAAREAHLRLVGGHFI